MAATAAVQQSPPHHYQGISTIKFEQGTNGLQVSVETDHLYIRSVNSTDIEDYVSLYGDADVMQKYGEGKPTPRETIENRIKNIWEKRWTNNDPYSGLAVFKKCEDGKREFVGHVVLGHGDEPGVSEIACLFHKNHWRQGYGREVSALVAEFASATVKEGYQLDGKPLWKITGTARPDNLASVKILEKINLHKVGEETKFGALRYFYAAELSELLSKV